MPSNASWSLAARLTFLLVPACGADNTRLGEVPRGSDAGLVNLPPAQRIVIGTGARVFEPLADGAHVPLIAGIQGAYHVWTSVLSYGFDADVLFMRLSCHWADTPSPDGELRLRVAARPTLDADAVPARLTVGWPSLVQDPLCDDGRALSIDVTMTDDLGHTASDSRVWILDVPEEYRPSDCAR
jgi:hypothetical protein